MLASVSLSRDGRWLVTATRSGEGVRVWDLTDGKVAWRWPGGGIVRTRAAFSPDGRWLATSTPQEYRLWEAGSGKEGPTFACDRPDGEAGPIAFSRDGALLAIAQSLRRVQLIHAPTGRVLASLQAADAPVIADLCFGPDGATLAAAAEDAVVHLWDLRLLRQELAKLDLDWDLPAYPPAEERPRLAVEVVAEKAAP
jgi:WD40 repeat protein